MEEGWSKRIRTGFPVVMVMTGQPAPKLKPVPNSSPRSWPWSNFENFGHKSILKSWRFQDWIARCSNFWHLCNGFLIFCVFTNLDIFKVSWSLTILPILHRSFDRSQPFWPVSEMWPVSLTMETLLWRSFPLGCTWTRRQWQNEPAVTIARKFQIFITHKITQEKNRSFPLLFPKASKKALYFIKSNIVKEIHWPAWLRPRIIIRTQLSLSFWPGRVDIYDLSNPWEVAWIY